MSFTKKLLGATDNTFARLQEKNDQRQLEKLWRAITTESLRFKALPESKLFWIRVDIGKEAIEGIEGDYFVGGSVYPYHQGSPESMRHSEIITLSFGSTPEKACLVDDAHYAFWLERVPDRKSAIALLDDLSAKLSRTHPMYRTGAIAYFMAQAEDWERTAERFIQDHPLVPDPI